MATEFKKLSEVTILEEVNEEAHVLVEENGEICRVPKTAVGGAGGIKTAIIRDSGYLNTIAGVSTLGGLTEYTYECINMTFEEAYEIVLNGEPFVAIEMVTNEPVTYCSYCSVACITAAGVPCLVIEGNINLYWTTDGLSTSSPSQPK